MGNGNGYQGKPDGVCCIDSGLLSLVHRSVFTENISRLNLLQCLWPFSADLRVNGRRPYTADLSAKGLKIKNESSVWISSKLGACIIWTKVSVDVKKPAMLLIECLHSDPTWDFADSPQVYILFT